MKNWFLQFSLLVLIASCGPPTVQEIIDRSIEAHGQSIFQEKEVSFTFRDRDYTSKKGPEGSMVYLRSFVDSIYQVKDSLVNAFELTRFVDGERVDLDEEWHGRYARSVNSVFYFSKIPLVANDPAVKKELIGGATIEGQEYFVIKITFQQEGGGEDFEDEFRYWIHQESYLLDYLAYNYQTDEGGTRFRKAINRRTINGMVVQDYINYGPEEKFPPLDALPNQFESGELKELSRIINTNWSIN